MAEAKQSGLKEGLVVASFGRSVLVQAANGQRLLCHPRRKKNEALVGDAVHWAASGDEGVIEAVLPRRNVLRRQDDIRTKSFAANLDQIIVWLAVEPEFSADQLNRILVAAAEQSIPAYIYLNKSDLAGFDASWQKLQAFAGVAADVQAFSTLRPEADLPALRQRLQGQRSFLIGPSGSGKSSLINTLLPDAQIATNTLSQALKSGRHTTTATTLHWLDVEGQSALIDSPGFQEFGLQHILPANLALYMPDFKAAASVGCKFSNCSHLHEPGCAVRAALEAGQIHPLRYRLYAELLAQLQSQNHWR